MEFLQLRVRNLPGVIFFFLSLTTIVHCDHPAPVDGAPPPPISPNFGYPGGFGGFPGFGGGAGFSKSLNLNAGGGFGFPGIGAYPGGIGGPVPEGLGGLGDIDPSAFGGGFSPFGGGLLGPSYIPQTWLGSALSAKGDLLFPIVLFIFFVVGVWTVIQFLLTLVVPIIAGKFGVEKAVAGSIIDHKLHGRALSKEEQQTENLNSIMRTFAKSMKKFNSEACNYNFVCNMGNSAHSKSNTESIDDMFKHLDTTKLGGNDPELIRIFQEAAKTGDVKCNEKYKCIPMLNPQNETKSEDHTNTHSAL